MLGVEQVHTQCVLVHSHVSQLQEGLFFFFFELFEKKETKKNPCEHSDMWVVRFLKENPSKQNKYI